jgi:maltose alpha-D-glucosyltransferase/alpha-amylase
MGDDLTLNERDSVRTPMHWSADRNAGFSEAEKTIHPVISDGPFSCEQVNVAAQRRDTNSLFNWTASMIRLRKETPEIGWGDWRILKTGSRNVLALLYEWRGSAILTLHNFSAHPQQVKIRPGINGGEQLINVMVNDESRAGADGVHRIALEAHGYRWYRVGKLNAALRRERR